MKQVKTVNGLKTIDDWTNDIVPIQLQEIIHEHRYTLIEKLVPGLEIYVQAKLNKKATKEQLDRMKERLFQLKNSPINMDNYAGLLELVLKNDRVNMDSGIFYAEIDQVLLAEFSGLPIVYAPGQTRKYNFNEMIALYRRELVLSVQTEKGLREYIQKNYGTSEVDDAKIIYLLHEVREYFKNDHEDYTWLVPKLEQSKYASQELAHKFIFIDEMKKILNRHFEYAAI
jgi:hypothetical protein